LVLALDNVGVELGIEILVLGSPLLVVCSGLPELVCSVLGTPEIEFDVGILVLNSPLLVVCSGVLELVCWVLDSAGIKLDVGIPVLNSPVLVVCAGMFELVCSVPDVRRVSTEDDTPNVEDNRSLVLEAPRVAVPTVVEIGRIRL
jgi:hypothetical protein